MVIAALALLVLSVGLGIWIGVAGSPYNVALLAVHKLSSVAFAVLGVIAFVREVGKTGMAAFDIAVAAVFAVSLAALLATGGILSGQARPAVFLRALHIAASVLLSAAAGWWLVAILLG